MTLKRAHAGSDSVRSLPILLIPALVIVTFAPVVGGFFLEDDFVLLRQAKFRWSLERPREFFLVSQNGLFTPLNNVLFWLEYQLFGLNQVGYVLVSVCLHLVNSLLVGGLSWQLTRNRAASVLAGSLFAVGFSHHQATSWIAAYVHLVTAFLYLSAVISFLRWQATRRWCYYVLSLALFTMGLFSKEPIVTLPIVLVLGVLLMNCRERAFADLVSVAPFIALDIVYVGVMYSWQKSGPGGEFLEGGVYGLGLHGPANFGYLAALIAPAPSPPLVNLLAKVPIPHLAEIYRYVFALSLVPFVLLVGYALLRGDGLRRYCALWIPVTFVPFIFVKVGMDSRYLYLPAVGFVVLVAALVQSLLEERAARPRWRKWVCTAVALCISVNISLFYVWQVRMNQNGRVRKTLIEQIVTMHSRWPKKSEIRVEQLNPKFGDVDLALPLWIPDAPRFNIVENANGHSATSKTIFRFIYDDERGRLVPK